MENKKLMNKMKFYSKKTFAVMLALVMMMSCWVFTPMIAEAATTTQGTWYFMFTMYMDNEYYNDEVTSYIEIWDADENVIARAELDSDHIKVGDDTGKEYYFSSTTYPTTAYVYTRRNNTNGRAEWTGTLYVNNVSYEGTSVTYSSSQPISSTAGTKIADFYVYSGVWGMSTLSDKETITNQPYFSAINTSGTLTASSTIPTTGSSAASITTSGYYYPVDQFGVRMPYDISSISLSGTQGIAGVTAAASSSSTGSKISYTVTDAAQIAGTTDTNTITSTVSYTIDSTTKTATTTLTLTDPKYTFAFDGNGGSLSTYSISQYYGDLVGTLPTGTLANYTLVGYSTDKLDYFYDINNSYTITNQVTSSTTVSADTTVYAAWLADNHTVTINYDTNGDGITDSTVTQDVPYSKTLTDMGFNLTASDLKYDETYHYTFNGWTINNVSTNLITTDETLMSTAITDNVTYTATYSRNAHTWNYDMSYAATEGADGLSYCYCSECGYILTNETLDGWWNVTVEDVNGKTTDTITAGLSEPIATADIPADLEDYSDETYDYTFEYWAEENDLETEFDFTQNITKSITLVPVFSKEYIDYTITYVDGDGVSQTVTGHYDEYILDVLEDNNVTVSKSSENPAIEYIFDYWTYDVGGATVKATDMVTGNMTINANFDEEKVTNVVTVNDEDGDFITSYEVEYGETLAETGWITKDPTKAADETNTYAFSHWKDEDGNKIDPDTTEITSALTLSPVFTPTPIDYTITWQNDDGSTYETSTFNYGDTLTFPEPPPTKTNAGTYETWTFTGWKNVLTGEIITYNNETGEYNSSTTVDGNATYIATFVNETESKTVTVLDKDGKTIATITVTNGDTLENIAVFSDYNGDIYTDADKHYTFSAWKFITDGYTTSDISTTPITDDVTIQAVYTSDVHNYNDAVEVRSATCTQVALYEETCKYCSYVHQYEGTVKAAHTYEWTNRVEPSGSTAGSETQVCSVCQETGETRALYLVTFSNEGTTVESFVVTEGVDNTLTSEDVPTAYKLTDSNNVVYTFECWKVNNVKADFDVDGGYPVTSNTTFHASFTSEQHYVVSYMTQNNLYMSGLYPTGSTLVLLDEEFNPQGYQDDYNTYAFSYWSFENPDEVETPEKIDADTEYKITADTTIYAVYEVSQKSITVTYDAGTNGGLIGTEATVAQTQYAGTSVDTSITAAKASDDDYAYDFSHWSLTSNGAAFSGTITADTTLYAVYSQVKLYTVTFYDEDKVTPLASKIVRADAVFTDDIINTVAIPTKDPDNSSYYAFTKWVNDDGSDVVTGSVLTADLSVYATYETTATRYYTISFIDFWGDTIQTDKFEYEDSFPIVPNVDELIEHNGQLCYFLGWYDASDDNKSLVTFPSEVTADTTYIAYYQHDVMTYSVTYMDETGENVLQYLDQVVGQTSAVYTGAIPTKATDDQGSYTFIGWALSTDATDTVTSELSYVTKNLVVYAKFQVTGHKYTTEVTYPATCTTDGGRYFICEDCGYEWCKEVTEEATGHNYVLLETSMDSEYNFKEIWRCSGCGGYKYEAYSKEEAVQVVITVADTSGSAINYAKVVVYNGNNLEMYKTYTNSNGEAVVYLMYDGEYTVNITGSTMVDTLGTINISTTTDESGTTTRDYTVEIDDIDQDDCSCTCHKDSFWASIFRFFHNIFKSFTSGKISCCGCPDDRYYE